MRKLWNFRRMFGPLLAGLLASGALTAATVTVAPPRAQQAVTRAPNGPFRVAGNRIVDSQDRPFLLRGTQLREFRLDTAAYDSHSAIDFGPHSATSLSAIRLRFNMNAVPLPMHVPDASKPAYFLELAKVVRRANDLDLLVVLAAGQPASAKFWSDCAAYFKDLPNVMFDVSSDRRASVQREFVGTIRYVGATQPVLMMSAPEQGDDPNSIYEVAPQYASSRTDAERDAQFGMVAGRVPMLANGLDLHLEDATECSTLPSDPTAAAQLVEGNLDYFDAHQISWTISALEPGKLVKDLSLHDATSLENGWTCGHPVYPYAGLGRVLEGHLRSSDERGLFVVSGSGGLEIGRGAFALAYGPIMAEQDSKQTGPRTPTSLGGLSVRITDAAGVSRPAGILWASAGWGQLNFVIPKDSAVGPARMTIVRNDGSTTSANITIAETAPGFVTGHSCRGPAIGSAIRVLPGGRKTTTELSACEGITCKTIAIPMTAGASTRIRIEGSGLRYAGSIANIQATIGGVPVRVVGFGPTNLPGEDALIIEIPQSMRGLGETDLICRVNGRVSNAVQVRIGGGQPVW